MSGKQKKALGKGLSALISPAALSEVSNDAAGDDMSVQLDVKVLEAGEFQPREFFDDKAIKELAKSIKENGVLQPVIVRKKDDKFQIIAGERRWRASQLAGLKQIPVVIKELSDKEALGVALIENIQRQNLSPMEEAEGFKRLQREFNYTQEQLATVLGKSRSHIANMLRLVTLPRHIKAYIHEEKLSPGHARTLIGKDEAEMTKLAEKIITQGLNVRQAEALNQDRQKKPTTKTTSRAKKESEIADIEHALTESLGMPVAIRSKSGQGTLSVNFSNLEELDRLLQRLG